jgi:hypothetical protein
MYGFLQDPGVVAPQLAAKMRQLPGFVDVNTDVQISAPRFAAHGGRVAGRS